MKHRLIISFVWLFVGALTLSSCMKEGDETILVNDPQDIPFITNYLPEDLWNMFGEENVHFGDQPPVVDMEFMSVHKYVAVAVDAPNHPQVGETSPVKYYHKFCQQYHQIASYYSMNSEDPNCKLITPVYMTGSGNDFTVYYFETLQTEGLPEQAVVMSGTVTDGGIKNFLYGYQIVKYNDSIYDENLVYPVNSIFVFKDADSLAERCNWYIDTIVNPQIH